MVVTEIDRVRGTPVGGSSGTSPAAAVLAVALVTAAALQGAFYLPAQVVLGGLLLAAAVLAAADRRLRAPVPVLAAAAGLAGWTVLRGATVGRPLDAIGPAALALGVVAAAGIAAGSDRAGRSVLARTLVGIGLVETALGVVAVAAHWSGPGRVDEGIWRASTTLTYANAAGAVVVLALVPLLFGLTAADAPPGRWRALGPMTLLLGMLAAASRGAVLALAVALVVLVAVRGPRVVLRVLTPPLAGAALAGAALLPAMPAGSRPHLLLELLGVALGGGLTLLLAGRPQVSGALLAVGAAAVGVAAAGGARLPGLASLTHARLQVADPARTGLLHAVLEQIHRAPVLGAGSGDQTLVAVTGNGSAQVVAYAHDEWLQVLWKDGAVGLVLLLLLVGTTVRWLLADRTAGPAGRARWGGALAALAALGVASGLDLLWHLPLVPLIGAVLVGLSAAPQEEQ